METENVVVIPLVCSDCGHEMEIECQPGGFGYMQFHTLRCLTCGKPNHPELPGTFVRLLSAPKTSH
jgi:DNA-directed RNA polymerase subunit RPC12/RpoP